MQQEHHHPKTEAGSERRAQTGGWTMGPQAHTSLPWVLPAYVQHFAFIVHRPAVYSIFVRHGPAPSKGGPGEERGWRIMGRKEEAVRSSSFLFPFGFSFLLLAFSRGEIIILGWDLCFLPYGTIAPIATVDQRGGQWATDRRISSTRPMAHRRLPTSGCGGVSV